MNRDTLKLNASKAAEIIRTVLSSKYFPFLTAAFTLASYYLGWDVALFYYIALTGILMLFLLEDITPVLHLFLFMSVSISLINTPSTTMGNSDYYHRPEIYIQIFTIVGLFIAAAICRLVKTVVKGKFKITPVFFGVCGFAFILIINGIFTADYKPKNLLFGFILAACILGIYSVFKDNVKLDANGFEKIAYSFIAFSILLLIELIVAYATTEDLFVDGTINRHKLIFGWGVYNTYGVMLLMCVPAAIYIAVRKRWGFVYTVYSFILFVALFFSCSRQAMVGGIVIYPFCIGMLLIKSKNRFPNICVLLGAATVGLILAGFYHEQVFKFFKVILSNLIVDGELDGSGRTTIWREAIEYFKKSPIFGAGFFVKFSYNGNSGLGFIPLMCHNTILQLLSSCGIVGLIAYLIHRTQTVISFFRKITLQRSFIALTILSILVICLFDNHIFNIFPTIIYGALTAIFEKSEKSDA